MQKIPALNLNRKIIPMWINSAMTLNLGTMSITKAIEYKQLVDNSAGCICRIYLHEDNSCNQN